MALLVKVVIAKILFSEDFKTFYSFRFQLFKGSNFSRSYLIFKALLFPPSNPQFSFEFAFTTFWEVIILNFHYLTTATVNLNSFLYFFLAKSRWLLNWSNPVSTPSPSFAHFGYIHKPTQSFCQRSHAFGTPSELGTPFSAPKTFVTEIIPFKFSEVHSPSAFSLQRNCGCLLSALVNFEGLICFDWWYGKVKVNRGKNQIYLGFFNKCYCWTSGCCSLLLPHFIFNLPLFINIW